MRRTRRDLGRCRRGRRGSRMRPGRSGCPLVDDPMRVRDERGWKGCSLVSGAWRGRTRGPKPNSQIARSSQENYTTYHKGHPTSTSPDFDILLVPGSSSGALILDLAPQSLKLGISFRRPLPLGTQLFLYVDQPTESGVDGLELSVPRGELTLEPGELCSESGCVRGCVRGGRLGGG